MLVISANETYLFTGPFMMAGHALNIGVKPTGFKLFFLIFEGKKLSIPIAKESQTLLDKWTTLTYLESSDSHMLVIGGFVHL